METTILTQTAADAKISVKLPGSALTSALDAVYQSHSNDKSTIPPRAGIDQNPAGRALLREAVQRVFTTAYPDIIRDCGLAIASEPKVTVLGASEDTGVELTLEFALKPELKLGRYKGIRVKMPESVPTDEEYAAAIAEVEARNKVREDIDRPARSGDIAVIDFTGFLDGEEFDGGAGQDYPLTLGSGQFIPGFEEQLIGALPGSQIDVRVTFPEDYQAPELAGKETVFEVKVKQVQELVARPLTDEQKEQLKKQIADRKKSLADQEVEDTVLGIILDEAKVDLPQAMIESEANICMQQFAAEAEAKGMSIDDFCRQTGKTLDSMRQEMLPLARRRISLRMVLAAIAEAEGIVAEESELEAYWDQMAQQYDLPTEQLKQYAGNGAEAEMRAEIVGQKAYKLLRESTILECD